MRKVVCIARRASRLSRRISRRYLSAIYLGACTVCAQKLGSLRAMLGAFSATVSKNSSARWRSESSRAALPAIESMPLTHASMCFLRKRVCVSAISTSTCHIRQVRIPTPAFSMTMGDHLERVAALVLRVHTQRVGDRL